jgi:hypothetical protein
LEPPSSCSWKTKEVGASNECNSSRHLELDRIALKMQQEAKVRWRYKSPLNRKEKWHVQNVLARRQQYLLRRWLRHVEILRDTEEVVHICEPEIGKILSDDEEKRSIDPMSYQEGGDELSGFHTGNGRISVIDLSDYQVGSDEILDCQVGNPERSVDLMRCRVGREETPSCPGGQREIYETV